MSADTDWFKMVAHKALYEQGILHQDINAGNVLLLAEGHQTQDQHGLLTDLDYAQLPSDTIEIVYRMVHTSEETKSNPAIQRHDGKRTVHEMAKRGALMTVSHFNILYTECPLKMLSRDLRSLWHAPCY